MLDSNSGWGRSGLQPRRTPGAAPLRLFGYRERPSASAPPQPWGCAAPRSGCRGRSASRGQEAPAVGRDSEPGFDARLDVAAALPPVGARGTVSPPAELIYGRFKKLSALPAAC